MWCHQSISINTNQITKIVNWKLNEMNAHQKLKKKPWIKYNWLQIVIASNWINCVIYSIECSYFIFSLNIVWCITHLHRTSHTSPFRAYANTEIKICSFFHSHRFFHFDWIKYYVHIIILNGKQRANFPCNQI